MREFKILKNGWHPFIVQVVGHKRARVLRDDGKPLRITKKCNNAGWFPILNIFVGKDPRQREYLGNSILLVVDSNPKYKSCDLTSPQIENQLTVPASDIGSIIGAYASSRNEALKHHYIYVGPTIYSFSTAFPIRMYFSPVGNSAVPYPYAIGEHGVIYPMHEIAAAFSLQEFLDGICKMCGLASFPGTHNNPYDLFYDSQLITADLGFAKGSFKERYGVAEKKCNFRNIKAWYVAKDASDENNRYTFLCPFQELCLDRCTSHDGEQPTAFDSEWKRLLELNEDEDIPKLNSMCMVLNDGTTQILDKEEWKQLCVEYMDALNMGGPASKGELGAICTLIESVFES